MIRKQFMVSGKVQGVWFRASTREQALILGLSGYAANLSDGSVRVQAQGSAEAVNKLEQWLQRGPALAKVSHIEVAEIELQVSESAFEML
ncbi:MAG: acylphosphatase [Arenimonas sp.]